LIWAASRALAQMGARVEIDGEGENLVRRLTNPAETPNWPEWSTAPVALVQAQGLPNLMHELVHAVQAGALDDDHGIDYGAIPFDLQTPAGRAVLWDELSCCVISCAHLWSQGRAARAGRPSADIEAEVHDWFREQVEIQPVFYGMDAEPAAFHPRVSGLLHAHRSEASAALERAYAATYHALRRAGASDPLARPPRPLTFESMWPLARPRLDSAECA